MLTPFRHAFHHVGYVKYLMQTFVIVIPLFSNLFFSYFRLVVPHQATTQRSSVCCFLRSAASCRTTAGSCRASTGRIRPSTATSRCGVREVSYQHFVPFYPLTCARLTCATLGKHPTLISMLLTKHKQLQGKHNNKPVQGT